MSTPDPERIKLLYMRALALPQAQRAAFVREQCGDNAALRASLFEMLGLDDEPADHERGREIGPYRLVRPLGEGGFGIVWLAEQREPVQRTVALKLLKPGMDSKAVLARFEQERAALGVMDHPAIARVLDAGADERGLPYVVMEYVDGTPITHYCDEHRLTLSQRLELFKKVCAGVHHAHTKGVIHRDLKPTNILVTSVDGVATPKIIDFGIAKALDQTAAAKSIFTRVDQLVGTLEYMSPEQATLGRIDIDTRSDVYSLGVVLYELLTGRLPFPEEVLRQRGFDAMLRSIREEDPPPPSRMLRETSSLQAAELAQQRQADAQTLERELRRELEWIPLMAMRKDRDKRYASAKEFGEDVERYLLGQALVAGPESRVYRARKFVRRNRVLVLAGGAIAASLLVATVVSLRFAQREARARALASEQRDVAEETLRFLNEDMLLSIDPERDGSDARVGDVLRSASGKITERFGNRPAVQARVQQSIGRALLAAGEAEQARPLLEAAEASPLAAQDAEFLDITRNALAEALYRATTGEEQVRRIRELVADATARRGAADPRTMNLRNQLGGVLRHRAVETKSAAMLDESEQVYKALLADRARVLGAKHIDTYSTLQNLYLVKLSRARMMPLQPALKRRKAFEAALMDREDVTRELRATFGDDDPETLASRSEELGLRAEAGHPEASVEAYPTLIFAMRTRLGPAHWRTIETMGRYAWCLKQLGRDEEAIEPLLVALANSRATNGDEHATTRGLARYLAGSLLAVHPVPLAERMLERAAGAVFDANTNDDRLARAACDVAAALEREGNSPHAARWRARCTKVPKAPGTP